MIVSFLRKFNDLGENLLNRKIIFLFLLILINAACDKNVTNKPSTVLLDKTSSSSIIGGKQAQNNEAVSTSTVALIEIDETGPYLACTGTLISENLILTAAHCVKYVEVPESLYVSFNTEIPTFKNFTNVISAEKIKVHPEFGYKYNENTNYSTGHNDVALIKLSGRAPENSRPVPILTNSKTLQPSTKVLLAGFGLINEIGTPIESKVLNYVWVPLAKILDTILVTDQTSAQGACAGDSGGPAYVEGPTGLIVVGITRGPHEGASDCRHYGEYTYASKFQEFILTTAHELEAMPPKFIDMPENLK